MLWRGRPERTVARRECLKVLSWEVSDYMRNKAEGMNNSQNVNKKVSVLADSRFKGIEAFAEKVWRKQYNWDNQEKILIFQGFSRC